MIPYTIPYSEWELIEVLESDFKRYPLPLCMNPMEEQRKFYQRHKHIEAIAKRFIQFKVYLQNKKP